MERLLRHPGTSPVTGSSGQADKTVDAECQWNVNERRTRLDDTVQRVMLSIVSGNVSSSLLFLPHHAAASPHAC